MAKIVIGLTLIILALALLSAGQAQGPSKTNEPSDSEHRQKQKLVVPAGTQIKVDVSEENPPRNVEYRTFSGKVVNPIQVDSEVAIPALSKVTVQVSARHYDSGYQEVMELTDLTVDGMRYDVRTDQIPVLPGSISEAACTLLKDVTVKR